jgi:hypothetical protein
MRTNELKFLNMAILNLMCSISFLQLEHEFVFDDCQHENENPFERVYLSLTNSHITFSASMTSIGYLSMYSPPP